MTDVRDISAARAWNGLKSSSVTETTTDVDAGERLGTTKEAQRRRLHATRRPASMRLEGRRGPASQPAGSATWVETARRAAARRCQCVSGSRGQPASAYLSRCRRRGRRCTTPLCWPPARRSTDPAAIECRAVVCVRAARVPVAVRDASTASNTPVASDRSSSAV